MAEKKTVYRSSVTGRIITQKNAENHPRTSEKERVSVGKKK